MARTISPQNLTEALAKANREELIIDAYERAFGRSDGRPFGCDGLYGRILTEFKLDVNLNGPAGIKAVAQCVCYLRKFVYEGVYKDERLLPPTHLAVCDKNEAIVIPAAKVERFVHKDFDWTRPASSPDPSLVKAVGEEFSDTIVLDMKTESGVTAFLAAISSEGGSVLQVITRHNFDSIFKEWHSHFAADKEPQVAALAFLLDLQLRGIEDRGAGRVILRCEVEAGGTTKYFDIRVPIGEYESFWSSYLRPPTNDEMAAIIERKDRLVIMQLRRTTGEFFTPLPYCSLAWHHLEEAIPDRYEGLAPHHSLFDDYNIYDPCCGTGNLTIDCPPNMLGKLFMSTLNQEDVDVIHNSGQNPNAVVFKFDFLNDGEDKFPVELKEALVDGKPWIFILNPPYAAGAGEICTSQSDENRSGVSKTVVGKQMSTKKMGHACQNILSQFLYRLNTLTKDHALSTTIGLFSNTVVFVGTGYRAFVKDWRSTFGFEMGFCFDAAEFSGTNGHWPILFSVWGKPNSETITLDVRSGANEILGQKQFFQPEKSLNEWVDRPKATVIRPPMNGALGVVDKPKVRLDRWSEDAIAYLEVMSNDVQQCQICFPTSGPNHHGDGWSITPSNFYESMVCLAARRLVVPTWLNWQDQFSVPDTTNSGYEQFSLDAIVWSLFEGKNQTSSIGNITYKGEVYDIPNHFFWMTPEEMMQIDSLPRPIWQQCRTAKPRFVAEWLQGKEFSPDAAALLELGKDLVWASAPHRMDALPKFQLDRYDAGWYQVRMGLFGKDIPFKSSDGMMEMMEEFKVQHKALGDRLRPGIYDLGFLPRETLLD